MGEKRIQIALIVMFILMLLSLRMFHPASDPPETLSMSAGPYGDPGGYAFNARNKILFGQWEIDDLNTLYTSPIPTLMTYLSFKAFGIGFIQMNLVPFLFSCLSLLFLFFLLKKTLSGAVALTAVAFSFIGINYLFMMYSRIANRVMPMIFFLVLALFCFIKGDKKKNWYFLAGVSSFLAFMTKSVCFYIIGALFLGLFVYLVLNFGLKKSLLPFSLYSVGFSACLLLWLIFIYLPHSEVLKSISALNVQYLIPPKSIPKMLYHFWIRPPLLLHKAPIISLLSGLSLLLFLFRATQEPKRLRLLEWIILFWFVISLIYFSIIYQRVTRHFIPQIIPMVFLSSWLIHDFFRSDRLTKPKKPNLLFGFALFFWLLFPASKILKPVIDKLLPALSDIWIATSLLVIICSALSFIILFLMRMWPENFKITFSPFLKKSVIFLILLGVLFFNGKQYLSWVLHPQFKLQSISLDFDQAFDHATISGLWAPVVCMENRHRAHESFRGYINDEKDFLKKNKITHVFASTFFNDQEINYYRRNFAEAMQKARLQVKYVIWRGQVLLYELNPSPEFPDSKHLFEAEIYTQRQGMPRYDPDSSGNFSVLSEKRKSGFVAIVSTEEEIPKGRYKIIFRMKREELTSRTLSRMARIDVVSPDSRRLLVSQDISTDDFPDDDKYHGFSLPINLPRSTKLNFRVYSDGLVAFWVDWIRVEKT